MILGLLLRILSTKISNTMNKVEEMHQSFECGQMVSSSDLSVRFEYTKLTEFSAKIHAQVTEDVACKFAEWIIINFWIVSSNDLWYQKSDGNPDEGLTTSELFAEFIKTL